jgi:hypothetical protein
LVVYGQLLRLHLTYAHADLNQHFYTDEYPHAHPNAHPNGHKYAYQNPDANVHAHANKNAHANKHAHAYPLLGWVRAGRHLAAGQLD